MVRQHVSVYIILIKANYFKQTGSSLIPIDLLGQNYLAAMAAAANFAWVNRSSMTFLTRQAFGKMFNTTPDDLDMHVIYDVSHNIAKVRS